MTIFTAYVDNRPDLVLKAERLVWSLVTLGKVPAVEIRLHVSPSVERAELAVASALGVRIVVSEPWDGLPYCNKVKTLLDEPSGSRGSVMILDCDTVVLRKLPRIQADLAARPADRAIQSLEYFEQLGKRAGIKIQFTQSDVYGDVVPTELFDGGVYFFSRESINQVRECWPRWISWLEADKSSQHMRQHFDEIALMMAVVEKNWDSKKLSRAFNFPVHRKTPFGADLRPFILHYHNHFTTSGRLRMVPNFSGARQFGLPMVSWQIRRLNRKLRDFYELRERLMA